MECSFVSSMAAVVVLGCADTPVVGQDPEAAGESATSSPSGDLPSAGVVSGGLGLPLHGSAHVSCPDNDLLTTLGWATLSDRHQLGEVYLATLDYVGEEPCIALRYDSLLPGAAPPSMDQASGPLLLSVSRGLELEFDDDVPLAAREEARTELIDDAAFRLEGTSVSWLDPPGGTWLNPYAFSSDSEEYAETYRLYNATYYPFDQFVFIVTRRYFAERVTTPEGGVDDLDSLRSPDLEIDTSYECAALPLGDGGATLYDGVFVDATEGFGSIIARADLPRRFCPEIPGSARPPGNGALRPPTQ